MFWKNVIVIFHLYILVCFSLYAQTAPESLNKKIVPSEPLQNTETSSSEYEVLGLKFFESGREALPLEKHHYQTQFPKSSSRYMNCKISFKNLLFGVKDHSHDILFRYYKPDGSLFGEFNTRIQMPSTYDYPATWRGFGYEEPGNWQPGTYQVRVWVDNKFAASSQFKIYDDSEAASSSIPITQASQKKTDNQFRQWDGYIRTDDNQQSSSLAQDIPYRYQFKAVAGVAGGILTTEMRCTQSADEHLKEEFVAVAKYFEGQPKVLSGIRDTEGREAEIMFRASRNNKPVVGIATAFVDPGTSQVVIQFGYVNQDQCSVSFPRLISHLHRPTAAKTRSQNVNWRWTQLPDGSGKIKLPDGWQLSANQGNVAAEGPQGKLSFGFWVPVRTPDDFMVQMTRQYPIVAPFSDPVTAYQMIAPQYVRHSYLTQGMTPPEASFHVIESSSIQYEGTMQTALILADEYYAYSNGQSSRMRNLLRVSVARTDATQWIFYFSVVGSPPETFAQNLPILWEIWQSWKTDDRVFQQRMNQAMRDLNEASRIFQEGMQAQSQAMDRALDNWSERMREYQYLRDTEWDQLYEVNLHQSQALADELNREAGYQRYQVIPLREFNRR